MPKTCCVHGCNTSRIRNPDVKFYIIPKEPQRRNRWLRAINRARTSSDGTADKNNLWSPKSCHTYVCSLHFISGEKKLDPCHPDHVPSIFPHNENSVKSTLKVDRHRRFMKRTLANENREISATTSKKRLKFITENHVLQELDPSSTTTLSSEAELNLNTKETECQTETTPMNRPLGQSEREMLYEETINLRQERDEALIRVKSLEEMASKGHFSSHSVEGQDIACKMMTGISWNVFLKLFAFLSIFMKSGSAKLPLREQLFLTLVKLRHNVTFEFLAQIKGVAKTTIIDNYWKWIDLMYVKLDFMIRWADRETIFQIIPHVFKEKFPRLTSIIDCFEIFIEAPKNLLARAQCFSNYKRHTTVKVFVSCNPLGSINYISKVWGGRVSDVQIVRESDFISSKYHMPGDQILADRGFTLHDDFATKCSAELITPSFTKGRKQLSAKEVEYSRTVSSVRIHIERVIGLMKNRYGILKGIVPIRCVQSIKDECSNSDVASYDKIVRVCAALTNMGPSIVFKRCD